MLYNLEWERKSGELTIPNLIRWLETQPPNTRYDYCNASTCLVAEFLKAHGAAETQLGDLPDEIDAIVNAASSDNWTYGDALKRARESLVTR